MSVENIGNTDFSKVMRFYEYEFTRDWRNGGNVIMFDPEITLERFNVELGDCFVVDVRNDQVCFVQVDSIEGLDNDSQLDLFSS